MNNRLLPLIILAATSGVQYEMEPPAASNHDWSSRPTRYAKRSFISQKKRRIQSRRRQSFPVR